MNTPTNGDWKPIAQAAAEAGVSRRTAFRLAKAGKVPVRVIDGRRQADVETLRQIASSCPRNSASACANVRGTGTGLDEADGEAVPPAPDRLEELGANLWLCQDSIDLLRSRVARLERLLSSPSGAE